MKIKKINNKILWFNLFYLKKTVSKAIWNLKTKNKLQENACSWFCHFEIGNQINLEFFF